MEICKKKIKMDINKLKENSIIIKNNKITYI